MVGDIHDLLTLATAIRTLCAAEDDETGDDLLFPASDCKRFLAEFGWLLSTFVSVEIAHRAQLGISGKNNKTPTRYRAG